MKFIQFTVLVLSIVISAGLGFAAKFGSEWNQSTVAYFAGLNNDIDTSVQETLTGINYFYPFFNLSHSHFLFFSFFIYHIPLRSEQHLIHPRMHCYAMLVAKLHVFTLPISRKTISFVSRIGFHSINDLDSIRVFVSLWID